MVYEDIALLDSDLFFGSNNESQIYNSTTNYLCAGVRNGFYVFHKVTNNTIFNLERIESAFYDWKQENHMHILAVMNFL